jgi:hypothetical protein
VPQLFLDVDYRLGMLQFLREPCILPLGLRQFHRKRIARGKLGSRLDRRQPTESTAVALPAPIRQRR